MPGSGFVGVVSFLLLAWRMPGGLSGVPVNLKTWAEVGRNPLILALLLVTTLQTSGQFAVFTFIGPLLAKLTGAGPDAIGLVFAIYGVCGFVGNVIASRIVDLWGAYRTSVLAIAVLLTGASIWALGAGIVRGDGGGRRDLGAGLRLDQFDAAGAPGHRRAALGVGDGLAQHLGAVYRPGGRLRHRRRAVRRGFFARDGLCRRWASSRWRSSRRS